VFKTIVLTIVAVSFVALLVWGTRDAPPARHKDLSTSRLEELVRLFWIQGFDGATLVVQAKDSVRFFQLRKEKKGDGFRLRSDYPRMDWSEPYYDRFHKALASLKVTMTERTGVSELPVSGVVDKTLIIDFGDDPHVVVQAIEILFRDIYKVDLSTDAELTMQGINPFRKRGS
jgi:hypothetical protein